MTPSVTESSATERSATKNHRSRSRCSLYRLARTLVGLLLVAGLVSACDMTTPTDPSSSSAPPTIKLSDAEQGVLDASGRDFGLDLFRALSEKRGDRGNVVFSPLSVSVTMMMVMNGARDSTLHEIKRTMGVDGHSLREINGAHRSLLGTLPSLDENATLHSAQSMWVAPDFPVKPAFTDTMRSVFDAEKHEIDFAAPDAADRVNNWVADQTRGEIEELVLPSNLSESTVMALLNAIYFKAPWQSPFDPDKTSPAAFTRVNGSTVEVPMMQQTDTLRYVITERAEAVDLPYGNGAFRMTVIVPRSGTTAQELATDLRPDTWTRWLAEMETTEVNVKLPRFSVEEKAELKNVLVEAGIQRAFSMGSDLSGISPSSPTLDKVKHKASVTVNEEGTVAAAATGALIRISNHPSVTADRPFLFVIREAQTGTLLFLARVADPTA